MSTSSFDTASDSILSTSSNSSVIESEETGTSKSEDLSAKYFYLIGFILLCLILVIILFIMLLVFYPVKEQSVKFNYKSYLSSGPEVSDWQKNFKKKQKKEEEMEPEEEKEPEPGRMLKCGVKTDINWENIRDSYSLDAQQVLGLTPEFGCLEDLNLFSENEIEICADKFFKDAMNYHNTKYSWVLKDKSEKGITGFTFLGCFEFREEEMNLHPYSNKDSFCCRGEWQ